MKSGYKFIITNRKTPKGKTKAAKRIVTANIAKQYMELQQLRERITEAESRQTVR